MEWLTGLIRQISVIAVIAAFLELLLPSGEMQKFIRFFMGLLILVAFMNPIMQGRFSPDTLEVVVDTEQDALTTAEILAAGQQMDDVMLNTAEQQMKEELSQQITALIQLINGVKKVAVKVDLEPTALTSVTAVNLTVWKDSSGDVQQIQQDIIQMLTAFYQITPEKIECHIKEDGENGNQ